MYVYIYECINKQTLYIYTKAEMHVRISSAPTLSPAIGWDEAKRLPDMRCGGLRASQCRWSCWNICPQCRHSWLNCHRVRQTKYVKLSVVPCYWDLPGANCSSFCCYTPFLSYSSEKRRDWNGFSVSIRPQKQVFFSNSSIQVQVLFTPKM